MYSYMYCIYACACMWACMYTGKHAHSYTSTHYTFFFFFCCLLSLKNKFKLTSVHSLSTQGSQMLMTTRSGSYNHHKCHLDTAVVKSLSHLQADLGHIEELLLCFCHQDMLEQTLNREMKFHVKYNLNLKTVSYRIVNTLC